MKKFAAFAACILPCFLVSACLAACLAACSHYVPKAEQPVPPQAIEDYVGKSQRQLLYRLGQPDSEYATGDEIHYLYHWHTRDAVAAPALESAWHGNVAYVQRQLPTRATPLRAACDVLFVISDNRVISATPKGVCW